MDETFRLAAILCRSFKFVSAPLGIAVAFIILRRPRTIKLHRFCLKRQVGFAKKSNFTLERILP